MGLTLEAEQRLAAVSLVSLFDEHRAAWLTAAREAKAFVRGGFPEGSLIRRDDVAKALYPIIEVHDDLRDYLDEHKLRGKFWKVFFVDLIIDRTWDELDMEDE